MNTRPSALIAGLLVIAALLPACHDWYDDDYHYDDDDNYYYTGDVRFVNASPDTGDTRFFIDFYEYVELGTNESTGYGSFYDGYRHLDLYQGSSFLFDLDIFVNRDDEQSFYLIGSRPGRSLEIVGTSDALGFPPLGRARLGVINANVDALRFDVEVDGQPIVRNVDYLGFVDPPAYVSVNSGRRRIRVVESGNPLNSVGPFNFTLPDQRDLTVLIGGFANSVYFVVLDEHDGRALLATALLRVVNLDRASGEAITVTLGEQAVATDLLPAGAPVTAAVKAGVQPLVVRAAGREITRAEVKLERGRRYLVAPLDTVTGQVLVHPDGPFAREAGKFVLDFVHLGPPFGPVDVAVNGKRVLETIRPRTADIPTPATAFAPIGNADVPIRIDVFAAGMDVRLATFEVRPSEFDVVSLALTARKGSGGRSAVLRSLR